MLKVFFIVLIILRFYRCDQQDQVCPPYPTAPLKCTVGPCDQTNHASAAAVEQCIGNASEVVSDCFFYLKMLSCYEDTCDVCAKARLFGYYQTCRNAGQVADGSSPGMPASYESCVNDCAFANYASGMRRCLQESAYNNTLIHQNNSTRLTCTEIVDGTKDDASSGIIGSHSNCNRVNGFCTTLNDHGRTCFGYALGNSWGPTCIEGGGFTPGGSYSSVGLCHFISEVQACMEHGISPIQFLNTVCRGYQDGCLQTNKCNDDAPKIDCILACPTFNDIPVVTKYLAEKSNKIVSTVFKQYISLFLHLFTSGSNSALGSLEKTCMELIGREQPGCHLNL